MKYKRKVAAYQGIKALFPKILNNIYINRNIIQMGICHLKWQFGRQMN